MPDDFCIIHGYEFMACEKVPGAIPFCTACEVEEANERQERERAERQSLEDEAMIQHFNKHPHG